MYTAESIINWRTDWINNKTVLSLVVLSECIKQKDPNDEFVTKDVEQFRVLDLVPSDTTEGGYAYRVRVFQKLSAGFVPVQNFIPLMNGAPLPYIPFQFIGVDNTTPSIDEPPLIDLANVNISHYQTTADLEHGAHKTALPQPWANNIATAVDTSGKPVKQTFHYGGGSLWTFPSDTTVGMLEYTGQGLEALEKRLEVKENQMAILGARMLEAQKKQAETADTAAIHRSGEQASLAGQANTISRAMNNVLAWFAAWAGQSGDTKFAINTDFFAIPLDAQTILALVSSWQQGAISKETLFDNFQRGEIVSEATTFEDEEAKISNNPPMMSLGGQANPNEPGGSANNGGTGGQGNGPATGAV
jgi:hypothetical protein